MTGGCRATRPKKEVTPVSPCRKPAGVSLLLEVVFGLALFAVSILLLFGVFPNAQRAATQSKNVAIASELALEYLNRERALPYQAVGTPRPPEVVPISTTVNGVTATTDYTVSLSVLEPEPGKRKDITVKVAWVEGQVNRSFRLESFRVQYPGLVGSL